MKAKIFLVLIVLLFLPLAAKAEEASQEQMIQRVEILKQEIGLLRSLLINIRAAKQGAEITAQSYLAVNLTDNSVLLKKNPNSLYPPASVTKLMTATIATEEISLERKITLTEEMLQPYGYSPSLYKGLSVTAENLIKASLIQSVNDAAEALSHFTGKENFVALMNKKAEELGMTNTIFYDAHGLNPANRSTAQDLVKLLTYIHKEHPELLSISRDNDFWLPDQTGRLLKFRNMNDFYHFSSFIGGKTGYLPEAKKTFASIFNVEDKKIAIVLLYSDNRQADVFAIIKKLQQSFKGQ